MKKNTALFFFILLSGCTGDTLVFRNQGDARINDNSICIKSSPGDVLNFYLLSSSSNNYVKPIVLEDNINEKYPATCIRAEIKIPADYDLVYTLNGKHYRLNFTVDKEGGIYKK